MNTRHLPLPPAVARYVRLGTYPILLAGLGHLLTILDALGIPIFAPAAESLTVLYDTPIPLAEALGGESSLWNAYLGFSLSHGYGLICFAIVHLYILRRMPELYVRAPGILLVSSLWALVYMVTAIGCWFYAPVLLGAGAALCFGLARIAIGSGTHGGQDQGDT